MPSQNNVAGLDAILREKYYGTDLTWSSQDIARLKSAIKKKKNQQRSSGSEVSTDGSSSDFLGSLVYAPTLPPPAGQTFKRGTPNVSTQEQSSSTNRGPPGGARRFEINFGLNSSDNTRMVRPVAQRTSPRNEALQVHSGVAGQVSFDAPSHPSTRGPVTTLSPAPATLSPPPHHRAFGVRGGE